MPRHSPRANTDGPAQRAPGVLGDLSGNDSIFVQQWKRRATRCQFDYVEAALNKTVVLRVAVLSMTGKKSG
jgi:hypothetical protein